ncbi:hypothetical protein NX059_002472 [Plenodomus lindquistii]|nr:hypothetical protein NX059_002472 [Plenodomus lindquistii]
MLPRPLLTTTFALPYRRIPILAIGRHIYIDTSLIISALEQHFPSPNYGTIYPAIPGWNYTSLARGFTNFWADKVLFRVATGLIPESVWRTRFGKDRAQLIGHVLDAGKLGGKLGVNLGALDMHLSMLEPTFSATGGMKEGNWILPTSAPSLADIGLYYQLRWAVDISAGRGIDNLTGGGTPDTDTPVVDTVFNEQRYPGVWRWFHAFQEYLAGLEDFETRVEGRDERWKDELRDTPLLSEEDMLLPVSAPQHKELDEKRGLVEGARVSVAPDDTGRSDKTVGTLVRIGVEEVVVVPEGEAELDVRVHFPRLGFVVRRVEGARL